MAEHRAYSIPENADISKLVEDAKQEFYQDPNVIGVGVGHRRQDGVTHHDELALIVYVKTKTPKDVEPEFRIPREFQGIATDVVEAFPPDSPKDALGFSESHQHSDDMSYVDWPRLHSQWTTAATASAASPGNVRDSGNVCLIQDDGTLIKTVNGQLVVDFVRAYKLFRTTHDDIFDFVTFFTDTANGMPPQGGSSWYRFVFNDTEGIGFGPFDQRAGYESNVLQGIMFLNQGHFNVWRYVMLQEQEHRWAAFARYRDSQNGPIRTDHLLGGWGHWALNLDDDRSPMDYDTFDWVENGPNFNRVALDSEERSYCDLDLYLMGLLDPTEVKNFFLLSNTALISGNLYSGNPKPLSLQNILWADGPRNPNVADSQKSFKNAFVVLTGDAQASQGLVNTVDSLRERFQEDFFHATRGVGRVDTTLRARQGRRRWW
ncbi:MAG: hypothetical protein ACE5Q6_09595 [Dehalococcoidia bacterium]